MGPYFLDGCCEDTHTAYEFHGCFYHGCSKCFPADTVNSASGLTMQRTVRKDGSENGLLETTRLAGGVNVGMQISRFPATEHGGQNVRGQFEGYSRPFEPVRRVLWGSGQCHQIAGKDRIEPYHNKNQVRGFYQSLPGHQQERCLPLLVTPPFLRRTFTLMPGASLD